MKHTLSRVIIVRVESALREALAQGAAASGISLSRLARVRLHSIPDTRRTRPEDRDPPPSGAPAAMPAALPTRAAA